MLYLNREIVWFGFAFGFVAGISTAFVLLGYIMWKEKERVELYVINKYLQHTYFTVPYTYFTVEGMELMKLTNSKKGVSKDYAPITLSRKVYTRLLELAFTHLIPNRP